MTHTPPVPPTQADGGRNQRGSSAREPSAGHLAAKWERGVEVQRGDRPERPQARAKVDRAQQGSKGDKGPRGAADRLGRGDNEGKERKGGAAGACLLPTVVCLALGTTIFALWGRL